MVGVPDRIVLLEGRVYFIELKDKGKKPSKVQLYVHKLFAKAGIEVLIIDNKKQIDEIFSNSDNSAD